LYSKAEIYGHAELNIGHHRESGDVLGLYPLRFHVWNDQGWNAFGGLKELSLGLGIVRIDYEGSKVPQSPTQVLKPMSPFEACSDLCTDLETQ
jgi:hypothetical protein